MHTDVGWEPINPGIDDSGRLEGVGVKRASQHIEHRETIIRSSAQSERTGGKNSLCCLGKGIDDGGNNQVFLAAEIVFSVPDTEGQGEIVINVPDALCISGPGSTLGSRSILQPRFGSGVTMLDVRTPAQAVISTPGTDFDIGGTFR